MIKRIIKPFAIFVAKIIVWLIIYIESYLCKGNKDFLPALLTSLCFYDCLVFKIRPEILKKHIRDPDLLNDNLFIWYGDWDNDLILIEDHEKSILIRELFVDNKTNEETEFYNYAISKMNSNDPVTRQGLTLDSIGNINKYFEKNRSLFNNIKANRFRISLAPEIGVAIDRKGELIHYRQGHHTLSIAKILNEKEVVVRIRAIHNIWFRQRIKGRRSSSLSALRSGFKDLQKELSLIQ